MTLEKIHSQGRKFYDEKNFDAALKIAHKLQKLDPKYKMGHYLEAAVWKEFGNSVKEYRALKKILPLLDFSSRDEKIFASEVLCHIAGACGKLGLSAESFEFGELAKKMTDDKQQLIQILRAHLSNTNFIENFSAEDFRKLFAEYQKILADIKPFPKKFYDHEKIRVGFLSSDFRNHPVINWSWSLLTKLDKNFFKTYFYSNGKTSDKVTEYLRATSDGWREILNLSDEQAAKIIRGDEIDILFDLNGHTENSRLQVAAYRPAAVQISGVGYMISSGLKCFDYFLSDEICAGDEKFFTEKVLKLPHSHICYEPPTKLEPAENPPCLKNNFVTFGSFNQFGKINDSVLRTWKKILDAVPDSRLLLKTKFFNTDDGKIFANDRLKNFGFDLAKIEIRPSSSDWLSEYSDVDIALDTFPYTGGVTTCEALYMGVPVVSLYGQRHGTRFGLSILKNIGLDELAVDSYDEYINRAIMLAGDWELLTILRKNLRVMMKKSPLMDSENYLREIQAAFKKILIVARQKS